MTKFSRQVRLQRLLQKIREAERRVGVLEYTILGYTQERSIANKGTKSKKFWNDPDGLSQMRRKFVQEYPKDLNATRAAIRAGFAPSSAHVTGCNLLKDEKVVAALRKEYRKITKRNRIDQDRVVSELAKLAYSNISNFVKWSDSGISLTPSDMLSTEDTACIKEVSETVNPKGTTVKIKLYDKTNPLITLCKYLGLLDGDAGNKDTTEQRRQKMLEYVRGMFTSVPSLQPKPKQLPENVEDFERKLKRMEGRL